MFHTWKFHSHSYRLSCAFSKFIFVLVLLLLQFQVSFVLRYRQYSSFLIHFLFLWKSVHLRHRDSSSKCPFGESARDFSTIVLVDAAIDDVSVLLAIATDIGLHCDGTNAAFCHTWYNVFPPLGSHFQFTQIPSDGTNTSSGVASSFH
jgi:hypothetical protein